MTPKQWLALTLGLVLIGFIVFAFRKGTQVKPDDRGEHPPRDRYIGSRSESESESES